VLVMIAVAGFLVSLVTLSVAVGIAGPQAIANGAWEWTPGGWGVNWNDHRRHHGWRNYGEDEGPQTSREIAWSGGESLAFDLPADVQYTQAPGPAKLTVSGPSGAVNDVELEDGRIEYGREHDAHLTITVTAPAVTRFEMQGSGDLTIANYRQDRLDLDLEGSGGVKASGEAKAVRLNISGSADADVGAVKASSAVVDVEGSGDATVAPTDSADVTISGSGDVTLLTRPARLQSSVSGSGRVLQRDGGATPAAPPVPPTPQGSGAKRAT